MRSVRAGPVGSNVADDEQIDLETFNRLFIRPERGTATVVAQADDAAAEARLSSLLASIETDLGTAPVSLSPELT